MIEQILKTLCLGLAAFAVAGMLFLLSYDGIVSLCENILKHKKIKYLETHGYILETKPYGERIWHKDTKSICEFNLKSISLNKLKEKF